MGSNKGQSTAQSTSSTSADPTAAAYYRDLLSRVQGVASTPYQAYTGELVAGPNATQNAGVGQVVGAAQSGSPWFQQAAGIASNASQPISAGDIANYQSPYTQSVVDATQDQFDRQNAIQQAQGKGNAIAQGALGGNRRGVAEGQIAQAQQTSQAPVIAGLYDKSYQQALQAAQGQQQAQLQGAYGISNIANTMQNAGIAGGNAVIGAGGLDQQYRQAQDTANYQQFMQAQGYPYQQLQWASGVGTALGSSLGSTTSGNTTQTPAQPNPWTQAIGLGLAGASLFSDERVKEDVEAVGQTNDGQTIYRYRYKGSPQYHMGLLAQEVEERHPEAVGVAGGYKTVNYKDATEDAVERAAGGGVMPYSGAGGLSASWIPDVGVSGKPPQATQGPQVSSGVAGGDTSKLIDKAMSFAGDNKAGIRDGVVNMWNGITGELPNWNTSSFVGPMMANGGGVARPSNWDYFVAGARDFGDNASGVMRGEVMPTSFRHRQALWDSEPATFSDRFDAVNRRAAGGGVGFDSRYDASFPAMDRELSMAERFAPVEAGIADGTMDPQGANYTEFKPERTPMPMARPAGAPERPTMMAQGEDDDTPSPSLPPQGGVASAAFAPQSNYASRYGNFGMKPEQPADGGKNSFLGIANISDNAKNALLTAGLSMLSSRSPFLGVGVGEGGLAGVGAFNTGNANAAKAAREEAEMRLNAQKIADDLQLRRESLSETGRHNVATENNSKKDTIPFGWELKADGSVAPRAGFVEGQTALQRAKAAQSTMDDETVDLLANRVRAGDTKALVGLGRGAQGAENLARIQAAVARQAREGLPVSDTARGILGNAAQQAGYTAGSRVQGQNAAKLSIYSRVAFNATDLALEASKNVPRTQFVPVNQAINAWKNKTGSPEVAAFGAAINTLINEYATAVTRGSPTVESRNHAREMLNAAQSPEQFEAVVDMMRQELSAEEKALPQAKRQFDTIYNPSSSDEKHTTSEGVRVPTKSFPVPGAAKLSAIPPPAQREVGKVYENAQGVKGRWNGTAFERVQ